MMICPGPGLLLVTGFWIETSPRSVLAVKPPNVAKVDNVEKEVEDDGAEDTDDGGGTEEMEDGAVSGGETFSISSSSTTEQSH